MIVAWNTYSASGASGELFDIKDCILFRHWWRALILLYFALSSGLAHAAEVVALGASNTYGEGLQRGEDYPSQLEHLLRARGLSVSVKNVGISGSTSQEILNRLDSVLDVDTKVVVLQFGRLNDQSHGVPAAETKVHIAAILAKLSLRHIQAVVIKRDEVRNLPRQMDGIHFTAESQAAVAKGVLPKVVSALRH
jgi:acyl-CoA thioesterase-1